MNVQGMTHEQRGIFIDMMAIAWDSEEPGTISLSEIALCRELGIFKRTLRRLLADFPTTWRRLGGKLVQPKLREQWLKYQEYQQKMSAMAMRRHHPSQCSASATATASNTPLPPVNGGIQFFEFCRETIEVQMGRKKRLPSFESLAGARACDVVEFLSRHGFSARIVTTQ